MSSGNAWQFRRSVSDVAWVSTFHAPVSNRDLEHLAVARALHTPPMMFNNWTRARVADEHDVDWDAAHDDVGPTRSRRPAPGKVTLTSSIAAVRRIDRKVDGSEPATDANQCLDRARTSAGSPLPQQLAQQLAAALGTELSGVRVHHSAASNEASAAIGARAYTEGQDIHFSAGQYDPISASGRHLLAHEVAHTVQQRGASSSTQAKLEVSAPQDHHEREADRFADLFLAGPTTRIRSPTVTSSPVRFARKATTTPPPGDSAKTDRPPGEGTGTFQYYVSNPELLKVPLILHYSSSRARWLPVKHLIDDFVELDDRDERVEITPADHDAIKRFLDGQLSAPQTRSPPTPEQARSDRAAVAANVEAFGETRALRTAFFVEVRRAIELAHNAGVRDWRRNRARDDFGNQYEFMAWTLGLVAEAQYAKRKRHNSAGQ